MVGLFGENLKMSCIVEVPQEHHRPCLILNLSAQPDEGTPSVKNTTDREVAPESMQFGRAFPRILQTIWESDPDKGPVRVSNMDVIDVYHRGMLQPSQVGDFAYVIPSTDYDDCIIICIGLVLPMGWMDSPKYFCAFSDTLMNVANTLVYTWLPVPGYGVISKIPDTGPVPPYTLDNLTYIECYMDDVITAVQGGLERQRQAFP